MKNHELVNGRLLQTNKKWSALKQSQRIWICELTRKEHAAYIVLHGKLPMKKHRNELIDVIYGQIENRGIWIPYGEIYAPVVKIIDKMNRASSLFPRHTKEGLLI